MNDFTPTVRVKQVDAVWLQVSCDTSVAYELSEFFTFKVPNAQFTPAYRAKKWDGKIRLFNIYNRRLYAGLLEHIANFCEDRGYHFESEVPHNREVDIRTVERFVNEYLAPYSRGKKLIAHEHQIEAIKLAMEKKRVLLISPTSSGKSLIIYALVRYLLKRLPEDKKILIIVPTTGLVAQMASDFIDYSSHSEDWNADSDVHLVYDGKDKTHRTKRVIIATWQALFRMKKPFFDQFGAVFGDEAHGFKAKSLTGIMEKLENCEWRIGTTGTLDGTQVHSLVLQGLFGKKYQVTTTKELMDAGKVSELDIKCLTLRYTPEECKACSKMTYKEELDYLNAHPLRNKFITNLAGSLKGNTLILYRYVDSHGKPLYEMIKKKFGKERKVFFVDGSVPVHEREDIRSTIESEDNAIIVASFGTFSTGINIRRLHNIIFAAPTKSQITLLQSIGRQLRKGEGKDLATLYDISDDLTHGKKENYTLLHFLNRVEIYDREDFRYSIRSIRLPPSAP